MKKIEKTVFISYRRTNAMHARNVYTYLQTHGYDVFMDFESMPSGDFEQILPHTIKQRAHFVLILTPTALERCADESDWLRREIETALMHRRNIVPLTFDDFDWGKSGKYLAGRLVKLKNFTSIHVPPDYFNQGMERLIKRLDISLDDIFFPEDPVPPSSSHTASSRTTGKDAQYWFNQGNSHYEIGNHEFAIQAYSNAINLQSDFFTDAYLNRGMVYRIIGNYANAITDYEEVILNNPRNALAYNNLGNVYMDMQDYANALSNYDKAIKIKPNYALAYNNRGLVYMEGKQDYDRAIRDFTEAINLDRRYGDAYFNRGNAYFEKKEYDNAIKDYNSALQIDPSDDLARKNFEIALQRKAGR